MQNFSHNNHTLAFINTNAVHNQYILYKIQKELPLFTIVNYT